MLNDIIFSATIAGLITFLFALCRFIYRALVTRNRLSRFELPKTGVSIEELARYFPVNFFYMGNARYLRGENIKLICLSESPETPKTELIGKFVGTTENGLLCILGSDAVFTLPADLVESVQREE